MIKKLSHKQDQELKYLGFTSLGTLDEQTLLNLKTESKKLIKETKKKYPKGELFNLINSDKEIKDKSNSIVKNYLIPELEKYLSYDEVEIYPVSHILKPFGVKSDIWHQDSSIVDEREDFSMNAWASLVDSNRLNGCLWIFPGSHINTNHHRQFGFNPIEGQFLKHLAPYLKPITSKAGEILLFHRNLIHGSGNNYLPFPRIAIEAVVTSKNAQMFNYHRDESILKNKLLAYNVESSHFLKENPKEDFYSGEVKYDVLDNVSKEEMIKNLSDDIPRFIAHANTIKL